MYRHLDAADRLNNQYGSDPKIQRRIDDLTIYTRYVELFRAFKEAAPGDDQSNAYAELMTFVYRGRERMMYHGSEIFRRFERKDKSLRIPDGTDARTPEAENPWKDSSPFSRGDFVAMRRDGIKNNELFTFSPEVFDDDLQPAQVLVSPSSERGGFDRGASGKQVLHAWIDDPTKPLKITVTGGLIRHYRDRGDVRISLFKADEVSGDEDAMPLDTASVPPDGEPYVIELRSDHAGLHRIELIDGGDRTMVDWQRGTKVVWVCDQKNGTNFYGPWTFCFYVPKGQTRVAGYTSHASGSIVDPSGATALDFRSMGSSGFFDIPVPAGADGRIWWMQRCKGRRMLMTTPPVFARSPDELLLPRNIIEKDGIGK